MRVLGLDEAGRGSVLGPLVVGGFLWESEDQTRLREAGADDSKVLTAPKRATIRAALAELGTGITRAIAATEIDEANVNRLEERVFVELARHFRPDRVYLDAPVHPGGIARLRARLVAESGVEDWVVEPKADATWPVVGAASIFAKVERDAAIAAIGEPIGSGYPSDPVTRAWLAERIREERPLPPFVRTRWGTIESLRQRPLF